MLSVRARLAVMMFLQYFVWGAWAVEMGGYMGGVLKFQKWQIGAIYESTAIAAMVSPLFMGYVADRLMSIQKLLALLHLAGAAVLACAAMPETVSNALPIFGSGVMGEFNTLRATMILYALLYMPTLALTNSISFENMSNPEKEFPLVRLFGTIGWIVAGLVVQFILRTKTTDDGFFVANNFVWLAAGSSLGLGIFCFFLPDTPPKPETSEPTARHSILDLLKDRSFLVFTVTSFLICIPLAFYYNLARVFLGEIDAPVPTALMTLGQFTEIGFMALMPYFIVRLGVKRLLAVGMLAWVIRYVLFGMISLPLVIIGILLHGICYDFFFVGSQIYVDNKVDLSHRSRAQSFLAFVTLGMGMFLGARAAGYVGDYYPPLIQVEVVTADGKPVPGDDGKPKKTGLPDWDPTGKKGLAKVLGLKENDELTTHTLRFKTPKVIITDEEHQTGYRSEDLAKAIESTKHGKEDGFTPAEWRLYQQNQWSKIWRLPAIFAAVTLLLFLAGFRDDVKVK